MIEWLPSETPPVQICALVFLGNLAYQSEKLRLKLVSSYGAGEHLAALMRTTSDNQVLTSCFDLLQNLAQEPKNREILGEAFMMEALARHWSKEVSPTLRQRAFYHTRQLLKGSTVNIYRFLTHETNSQHPHQTLVRRLLFNFDETQDPATRAETGRVFAEIWRSIHNDPDLQESLPHATDKTKRNAIAQQASQHETPQSTQMVRAVQQAFSLYPSLAKPSLALIESTNPSLMTEGWFTMALMAQWKEGALVVCNTLCANDTFEMLKKVVRYRESGSKDYDNALHVVNYLCMYLGDDPIHGPVLQSLLPR